MIESKEISMSPASRRKDRPKSLSGARRKALRLHGVIARDLGVSIVSGRYRPGELLGNEIQASEQLKVSRTAYREAIRILNAKGLVESRPKVGTRVSAPESWQLFDPDVLSWIFEFDPDDKLLADLVEMRKMVEPAAAAFAAARRTKAHLDDMRRALEGMAKHTLATEAGRLADRAFHTIMLQASGNAFLISLTSGIAAAINWTTVFKHRENPRPRDALPDHLRVFEAIEAADVTQAHEAMYSLVELAYLDTKILRRAKKHSRRP
jgi:DNA-binding FadR family transcriptional regulator